MTDRNRPNNPDPAANPTTPGQPNEGQFTGTTDQGVRREGNPTAERTGQTGRETRETEGPENVNESQRRSPDNERNQR